MTVPTSVTTPIFQVVNDGPLVSAGADAVAGAAGVAVAGVVVAGGGVTGVVVAGGGVGALAVAAGGVAGVVVAGAGVVPVPPHATTSMTVVAARANDERIRIR
ncbi:MAG TPA: hypothetical protein VIK08_03635 [Candidatus Limnocylindrales bacterium]